MVIAPLRGAGVKIACACGGYCRRQGQSAWSSSLCLAVVASITVYVENFLIPLPVDTFRTSFGVGLSGSLCRCLKPSMDCVRSAGPSPSSRGPPGRTSASRALCKSKWSFCAEGCGGGAESIEAGARRCNIYTAGARCGFDSMPAVCAQKRIIASEIAKQRSPRRNKPLLTLSEESIFDRDGCPCHQLTGVRTFPTRGGCCCCGEKANTRDPMGSMAVAAVRALQCLHLYIVSHVTFFEAIFGRVLDLFLARL